MRRAGASWCGAFYFQDNDRVPQYRMEQVLRTRLAAIAQVERRFGWRATAVTQDDKGACVSVVDDATGQAATIAADYAVGCDGGNSMVREASCISRSGTDFVQLMALVVFRSRELHERLKRFPPRSIYRVLHPELQGYWRFFGRIDVGEGFFFHAPVPRDARREDFDFRAPLRQAAGFDFACEIDYSGFWQLRNAVAQTYRAGRVFIAGDAAHTHPPYGGFGLNNGLEDAVNLGWKLAARLQGWGGETLLDSYSLERQAVFRDVAEDFIAARIREEGEFLVALQSAARPGRIRARMGRARERPRPTRAPLRAQLRGLAGGFRRRRREVRRARRAFIHGPSRPPSCAPRAVVRPQRVRGVGERLCAGRL